ncbi:MAG: alpha/beta hydrolase, partial [Gemmatimonadaceae bacterium]
MVLPGRLSPEEMFPAGDAALRAHYVALRSGIRVRAVEAGAVDAPPVVFLPGWGCSAYIFRDTLGAIAAAGYRALAVDLKGHGLSDKPVSGGEYTLASMRSHVIDILDALGLGRVRLAGLSMGAALAAHVAAAEPERVSSLVLVSTVGFDGVPGLGAVQKMTPEPLMNLLPRIATRPALRLLLHGVYGKLISFSERDVDEYWAPTQFPEFTQAMRRLLHEFSWKAPFLTPAMPCLVVSGTLDYLARRETVEARARSTATMQTLIVP